MSKSKGRRYELELARVLEARGWLEVADVHTNTGSHAEYSGDLIGLPPLGERLLEIEVKYRAGAEGFKILYGRHALADVSIDSRRALMWTRHETTYYSGGLDAFEAWCRNAEGVDVYEVDYRVPDVVRGWLVPVDVLFCRAARHPWLVVWC